MASIAFPSIGILMMNGFSEQPEANIIRSQMESGFAKQARKSTVSLIRRTVVYVFTEAEYATFKTFFFTTAEHGTLFFDWTDPVDDVLKDTRIVDGQYTATPLTSRTTHYNINMTFETYE